MYENVVACSVLTCTKCCCLGPTPWCRGWGWSFLDLSGGWGEGEGKGRASENDTVLSQRDVLLPLHTWKQDNIHIFTHVLGDWSRQNKECWFFGNIGEYSENYSVCTIIDFIENPSRKNNLLLYISYKLVDSFRVDFFKLKFLIDSDDKQKSKYSF